MLKLRQNDLNFIEANNNKNETKFKFQGQSAISQRWFDLNFYWIEVYFSTHDPDNHKIFFQRNDDTQDENTFKSFQVTIGNSECVENFEGSQ